MDNITSVLVCLALLVIQLLLCFKAQKLIAKLVPMIILLVSMIIFVLLALTSSGWNALGYVAFAILISIYLVPCGLGWLVWFIYYFVERRKK